MRLMLSAPGADDLIRLLKAWRFWVVGAMLGALTGAAVYWAAPPPFRARATVNVDFHLEQAWPQNTDREQFYYLEREVRKLQEIANSDAVLGAVETAVPGVAIEQMRAGKLQLSQPGNGGWHFFADDQDPQRAAALASAWATVFVREVEEQISSARGGLEPFVTAKSVQVNHLNIGRAVPQAVYLLGGAALMLVVAALGVLFLGIKR